MYVRAKMFTPSIKLGNINGINFKVSVGWVLIFVIVNITLRKPEAYDKYLELINILTIGHITLNPAFPESQIAMLAFTSTVIIGIYLSIILHEIGHTVAALSKGISVESISLWIGGGVAEIESNPPKEELLITIAGPAVTAILILIYALISTLLFVLNITTVSWVFLLLSLFNTLMFIFNLLPLFPLDGGRIFRSVLTYKTNYQTATRYSFYTTITLVITVILISVIFSNYDYIFISTVVSFLAYIEYRKFKHTYNPEVCTEPEDFYIYEQTFTFDSQTVTTEQKQTLKTHICSQGGQTSNNNRDAEFIISTDPVQFQNDDITFVNPLLLARKLEQNGIVLPKGFKKQFDDNPLDP